MKKYLLFIFCLLATYFYTISETTASSNSQKISIKLPAIYIKNNTLSDKKLTSITISFNNNGSIFEKTTASSTKLPKQSVTAITSSIKMTKRSNTLPQFEKINKIIVDGKEFLITDRSGLDTNNPIMIN